MKKINIFETFSGLGAQHKAFYNIFNNPKYKELFKNKGFNVKYTSDWYISAIISYDAIHYGSQELYNKEIPSKDEMISFISNYTLSKDSKTPYNKKLIKKLTDEKLKQLYIAIKRTKNLGSILDIKGKDVKGIDLLTYSFPCQDLSIAGKGAGLKKDKNTRSGLLWEIERILIEMKDEGRLPRFLLMENVKALLQSQHLEDFIGFEKFLEGLGYMNTRILLNSKDFGVPQSRERVFLISELNGKTHFQIEKVEKTPTLGNFLNWNYQNDKIREENNLSRPNDTTSRKKMFNLNKHLSYDSDYTLTLTTKQDRHPNPGVVIYGDELTEDKIPGKTNWRFLSPRDSIKLMGFTDSDYERIDNAGISRTEIYKLAGNSIVVNVLEKIFIEMLKRY